MRRKLSYFLKVQQAAGIVSPVLVNGCHCHLSGLLATDLALLQLSLHTAINLMRCRADHVAHSLKILGSAKTDYTMKA